MFSKTNIIFGYSMIDELGNIIFCEPSGVKLIDELTPDEKLELL